MITRKQPRRAAGPEALLARQPRYEIVRLVQLVPGEKDQRRVGLIDDLVGAEPPQAELQ
jgi:hypothetical protein